MGILEVFFLIFLPQYIHAAADCPIAMCSSDGIPVRFPFRLEGQQPQNCGYAGFNLSCNNQGMTVLKLSHSGDFLVRGINYLTQQILLYDSDDCLPKRLLLFNLSGSPFVAAFYQNFTFLSCPAKLTKSRLTTIDCLGNSTTSVLATSSMSLVNSLSASCEIIITLPIPVSWPAQYDEGYSTKLSDDLQLTWYSPDCEECEAQGGVCGFHENTNQQIGCSNNPKRGNIS